MRLISKIPAQQLSSSAARYACTRGRAHGDPLHAVSTPGWGGVLQKPANPPQSLGEEVRDELLQRLEAVLFLAREPLNSRKLAQFANLADGTQARTLIRQLNELYDETKRAFRVEEVAGGYQLMTRRKFGKWLRRLGHVPGETRLSSPALETLAVIAYRQPVLRADIEAIRGVNCGEILRQLMERDVVRISGRSEELGRPYLYSTTRRFLNLFGLLSLEELPRAEVIRSSPVIAGPPPMLTLVSEESDVPDDEVSSLESDFLETSDEVDSPSGESSEVQYTSGELRLSSLNYPE